MGYGVTGNFFAKKEYGSFSHSISHHLTSIRQRCLYIDWPAAVLAVGHQIKFSIPSRPV